MVSDVKEGALRLGLGHKKAGAPVSLQADGLKLHWVLTAESGLLRKKVLLFSSVWAAITVMVARGGLSPGRSGATEHTEFFIMVGDLKMSGVLCFFLVLSA